MLVTMSVLALVMLMNVGMARPAAAQSADRQIVMVFAYPNTDFYGKWTELLYTEAFRRLNMELVMKSYPGERAAMMVSEGRVDGDLGRAPAFHEAYPQLIKVEEAPAFLKLMAFVTDPAIQVDGWESLRDTAYRVEYVRGTAAAEAMLPSLVKPENLSVINHWRLALRKLMAGRTDIYIEFEGTVLQNLAGDGEFKDADIRIAGVLLEVPVQAYLIPKHAELAPQLSAVLKAMKDEGLIERYRQMALEATGGTQ